jgi:hypothetical protein
MTEGATLYLHYPCFDGVISGVLAWEFLESRGWKFDKFCPVNYGLRRTWPSTKLDTPCAVVDFLYHPDAQFWADHHLTTFITEDLRREFEGRTDPWLFYNSQVGSCALLLWRNLSSDLGKERDRYHEMVDWAEKIDSARYATVSDAVLGNAPALQINLSLVRGNSSTYCEFLVRALRKESLSAVAQHPEVKSRFERVRALVKVGLSRFRDSARLEDGNIVVFDIEAKDEDIISRYAPFYYFPNARYSIGILRSQDGAKITAMRNPWREFQSIPLGAVFERYGGGGHLRVGSVIVPKERSCDAHTILRELISVIQKEDLEHAPTVQGATA